MDFGDPREVYRYFVGELFPEITTLIYSFGFIAGWFLVLVGVYHIGQYGAGRIYHINIKLVLVSVFVAVQLIFPNQGIAVLHNTLFETPGSLSYDQLGYDGPFSLYVALSISLVHLLGIYAYIRGLMIWGFAGLRQGATDGAFSRGLFCIIGGVLAISIVKVMMLFKHDFL